MFKNDCFYLNKKFNIKKFKLSYTKENVIKVIKVHIVHKNTT